MHTTRARARRVDGDEPRERAHRLASVLALTLCATLAGLGTATATRAAAAEGDQVTLDYANSVYGEGHASLFALSDGSFAYCLDLAKAIPRDGTAFTEMPAEAYHANGVDKPWNTDPSVKGKVLWVLAHGYPALTLEEIAGVAGIPDVIESDAIDATQWAIWHWTNNFDMGGLSDGAKTLADFLVDNSVPLSPNEPDDGKVSIDRAHSFSNAPGSGVMGPYVIHTDQVPVVRLTTSAGASVTDAAGNVVTTAVNGDTVYLHATGGEATLSAEGTFVHLGNTIWVSGEETTQELSVLKHTRAIRQSQISDTPATVSRPSATVGTTATDKADGDKELAPSGGVIADVISYTGLVPGTQYTASGELMDKATGAATGIKAETTFTAATADGDVTVEFAVDGSWAGKDLVAFEVVTADGVEVARHTDLDSVAQTVSVVPTSSEMLAASAPLASGSLARTGAGGSSLPAFAALLVAAGVTIIAVLRRATAH